VNPPSKNELLELIRGLKNFGYWIQINTNGTIFDEEIFKLVDSISMDCKCPSSGMKSNFEVLRELTCCLVLKLSSNLLFWRGKIMSMQRK
jgi:pyruvate-formate lyase-activating enzyme